MPRQYDSATATLADKAGVSVVNHGDAKRRRFTDPGGVSPGPSIKCPSIYEALKRKGYDKTKAAKISNAKCKE